MYIVIVYFPIEMVGNMLYNIKNKSVYWVNVSSFIYIFVV